jgi:oxaloacetate decarboxylase (Na+ extruding) subunit alpha
MVSAGGKITFVDTTLRDGPQALWSLSMRTNMMLPIAPVIDEVGYNAVEIMSSAEFKKCIRDLKEDPWERLRLVRQQITKTPLRFILGRYMSTFQIEPQVMSELWAERLAANGVRQMRISDPSNTPAGWARQVAAAKKVGIHTTVNLIYSLSPKHTDDYYAERARQAAALQPDALCLKDPGALITPERVKTLGPIVLANANGLPVEFHTHCVTGLGPLCYFEGMKLGLTCLNTAVPPLADAASNPSILNVIANARAIGLTPQLNEDLLPKIEQHFTAIAEREKFPIGRPLSYDYSQYVHQVPGGMISNFRYHLSKVGMSDRLPAVLEETARVRQELGHPIMVTPYSQFVGTQATLNVISGERYKSITDEVILYALGFWGDEERDSIDPDIRDRIVSSPRAKELANWEVPQPSLKEIRQRYGGRGVSDDELLLRLSTDKESVDRLRASGPAPAAAEPTPLLQLIERLDRSPSCQQIHIAKPGLSITLGRSSGHP